MSAMSHESAPAVLRVSFDVLQTGQMALERPRFFFFCGTGAQLCQLRRSCLRRSQRADCTRIDKSLNSQQAANVQITPCSHGKS
mmetsp:Transcript_123694/g.395772  ORF Transcript_123694/g.395772 Transcript_123694/m.395772 type:complete len:84 (+) Transcript_123694:592-843(+)